MYGQFMVQSRTVRVPVYSRGASLSVKCSGSYLDGAGQTIGEEVEQCNAFLSRIAVTTKHMSKAGRNDMLTLMTVKWNRQRSDTLASTLARRYQKAIKSLECQVQNLESLKVQLAVTEEQLEDWVQDVKQWAEENALKALTPASTKQAVERAVGVCKKVVSAFSNSWKRKRDLAKAQAVLGLPPHQLITETPTRWGSRQMMIERFLEQEKALSQVLLADKKARHLVPSWQDMAMLESLNKALGPLFEFIDALSGESTNFMWARLQTKIEMLVVSLKRTQFLYKDKAGNRGHARLCRKIREEKEILSSVVHQYNSLVPCTDTLCMETILSVEQAWPWQLQHSDSVDLRTKRKAFDLVMAVRRPAEERKILVAEMSQH